MGRQAPFSLPPTRACARALSRVEREREESGRSAAAAVGEGGKAGVWCVFDRMAEFLHRRRQLCGNEKRGDDDGEEMQGGGEISFYKTTFKNTAGLTGGEEGARRAVHKMGEQGRKDAGRIEGERSLLGARGDGAGPNDERPPSKTQTSRRAQSKAERRECDRTPQQNPKEPRDIFC